MGPEFTDQNFLSTVLKIALFALCMPIQSLNESRNLKNRVGVNVGCVAGGF
jgi:hypothetical protein